MRFLENVLGYSFLGLLFLGALVYWVVSPKPKYCTTCGGIGLVG